MRVIACLLLFAFSTTSVAESWLCVAEIEGGFDYNKVTKAWEHRQFKVDQKYVVRRSDEANSKWHVVEVGDPYPSYYCRNDFDEHGNLMCESLGYFRFNKEMLRFAAAHTYPYFAHFDKLEKNEGPDSMWMAAGVCSAI